MRYVNALRATAAAMLLLGSSSASGLTLPILSRPILKTYFQTGDKPTEQQFATLIDSLVSLADDRDLLGLRVYDPSATYTLGDTVALKRFGIGDTAPLPPLGYFNPGEYNLDMTPDFAGHFGYVAVLLGDSAGMYYGFLQLEMDPPNGAGTAPAISVHYFVYESTPNMPITMFLVPEPAAATTLFGISALFLRRATPRRSRRI